MISSRRRSGWDVVFVSLAVRAGQRENGDPCRIRTCDNLLRRQVLYPAELRDRYVSSHVPTGQCVQGCVRVYLKLSVYDTALRVESLGSITRYSMPSR